MTTRMASVTAPMKDITSFLFCAIILCFGTMIEGTYAFAFARLGQVSSFSKRNLRGHGGVSTKVAATRRDHRNGSDSNSGRWIRPDLIVMDLDNTLWTPELYQLNQKKIPRAKKDINLFADVPTIFQMTLAADFSDNPPKLAVASRAQNEDWALQLLQDFRISKKGKTLYDIFHPHVEIRPGTKKQHFQALREVTGVPYKNMIFFDDWEVNLEEVSQLGVLGCRCPTGLSLDIFQRGLRYYHELKEQDEDSWMGYVVGYDKDEAAAFP